MKLWRGMQFLCLFFINIRTCAETAVHMFCRPLCVSALEISMRLWQICTNNRDNSNQMRLRGTCVFLLTEGLKQSKGHKHMQACLLLPARLKD